MKLHSLLKSIDERVGFDAAQAHCDIPCSIYDPTVAQISALTVVRMVDLIQERDKNADDKGADYINSIARFVAAKEEHGSICKEEVRVLWGDYFKASHVEQFPELHGLVHDIMGRASRAKQQVDRDEALGVVEAMNRLAEIFWATKKIKTKRVVCPYKPAVETVYPDL